VRHLFSRVSAVKTLAETARGLERGGAEGSERETSRPIGSAGRTNAFCGGQQRPAPRWQGDAAGAARTRSVWAEPGRVTDH